MLWQVKSYKVPSSLNDVVLLLKDSVELNLSNTLTSGNGLLVDVHSQLGVHSRVRKIED